MVFYFEKRWRGITGPQKWQIPDDRCLVQKRKSLGTAVPLYILYFSANSF